MIMENKLIREIIVNVIMVASLFGVFSLIIISAFIIPGILIAKKIVDINDFMQLSIFFVLYLCYVSFIIGALVTFGNHIDSVETKMKHFINKK